MYTMKNLYQCEKCGKTWNEYDEAWACEQSHLTLHYSTIESELSEFIEYSEGKKVPDGFVMRTEVQSKYNHDTGEYEESTPLYVHYVFKNYLAKETAAALETKRLAEAAESKQRNDEYWERYRIEQAEKKAKEAEAAAKLKADQELLAQLLREKEERTTEEAQENEEAPAV